MLVPQVQVKTLKKNHPSAVMVAAVCFANFFVYQFGCILVFLCGVIMPFIFMFVHASLRLRGLKNKVRTILETFLSRNGCNRVFS